MCPRYGAGLPLSTDDGDVPAREPAERLQPPHVGAVYPFERAPEAMRLLQGGGTVGKVVLEVGGG